MLVAIKHIHPVTLIRRQRLLPLPGRILVRKGQQVAATDIVAEALVTPEHLLLDLALGLGLPADQADSHIQRLAGEEVDAGDIVAGPVGVGRRVVRAPQKGRIVVSGGGQMLLELDSQPFELRAGLPGVISDLIPDRGVVIQTMGALIQGVWGNGRMDYGLLQVLARFAEEELHPDRIDVSLRGSVVLGGICEEPEVLTTADELPLRGLILASMRSSLAPLALKTRCPILLTEGFGHIPMNPNAFNLLSTSQRREVSILAERPDSSQGIHPELIIPLPTETGESIPPDSATLRVGSQVRIIHSLHHGRVGAVVDLLPGQENLPSGILATSARVRLAEDELAVIPLVNLEILGNI
jgi:hypothetical protein